MFIAQRYLSSDGRWIDATGNHSSKANAERDFKKRLNTGEFGNVSHYRIVQIIRTVALTAHMDTQT